MSPRGAALAMVCALSVAPVVRAGGAGPRSFATADEAVRVLVQTVKAGDLPGLVALFGPEGQELVDTSDPAAGRRNREVFVAAAAEGFRLEDKGQGRKELVLGNESWPFPVPIVRGAAGWSFDAAAGREEVLNRRIGRNELAVIRILQEYVAAQRAYAATDHDGKPAGLFARRFGSDPGLHNGLYWPARRGVPQSPLGVLIAKASGEGYHQAPDGQGPTPLYGYCFRILEAQGPSAKGGAAAYVKDGEMSDGFGLVAWPVHPGASGVMTFIINQDGVAYQKDLGPETAAAARAVRYDPDPSWRPVATGAERAPDAKD
jgi:hypothetical protein